MKNIKAYNYRHLVISVLVLLLVSLGQLSVGQNTKVIAFIKDSISWEPINEATIHVTENNGLGRMDTTVMTGKKGMFRLSLEKNKEYLFNVKQAGYTDESIPISAIL